MTTVLPVALVGDELRVPCIDGIQRRHLSFNAAAATGALPSVMDAVQAFVPWYASAGGTMGYKAQASALAYEQARLAALAFGGRDSGTGDVALFRRNATEAIRHLAGRLRLSRDDVVVTTVAEHRANLLPWTQGATCRYVGCGKDGTFDTEDVVAALSRKPRPALLAITGASGVTGWVPPLPDIIEAAHRRGVPVLADAAQLAPHRPLSAGADFLVWNGHKMYAPFGVGVLIGPRRVLAGLEPGGSPDVMSAVALHAAIDALVDLGSPAVRAYEGRIGVAMRRGLAAIPGVRLLGPDAGTETLPVATFTVAGAPPALVAARLAAEHAIDVGYGGFGADAYLDRMLSLTREEVSRDRGHPGERRAAPGAVRVSAGLNVTDGDVRRLLAAVADVAVGDPPVPYHRDPSSGDFFPAAGAFPRRAA